MINLHLYQENKFPYFKQIVHSEIIQRNEKKSMDFKLTVSWCVSTFHDDWKEIIVKGKNECIIKSVKSYRMQVCL